MNIGIDMMGGDFAPVEAVKSLLLYLSTSRPPANLVCIGHEPVLRSLFKSNGIVQPNVTIQHAPDIIEMSDDPSDTYKKKPNSSIAIGFEMLATGRVDALISAGNTGAMLVGALSTIQVVKGVLRPAIACTIPKLNGSSGILLDVGLNTSCEPEHLNHFAVLGSIYAKGMTATKEPTVGLLNIGEEEGKGNKLTRSAYSLLKQNTKINFVGNIEGRDIFRDRADVLVCDGFTGNVVLKMAESLFDVAKERNIEDEFMNRFNYEKVGGTPVLGVTKPVIIGHGISSARAFLNMICMAERMVLSGICGHISKQFPLAR